MLSGKESQTEPRLLSSWEQRGSRATPAAFQEEKFDH